MDNQDQNTENRIQNTGEGKSREAAKPQSEIKEFLISYTDDNDEVRFPEYVRLIPFINDEFNDTGVQIMTGIPFTIKPDDIEKMGNWLLSAAEILKQKISVNQC